MKHPRRPGGCRRLGSVAVATLAVIGLGALTACAPGSSASDTTAAAAPEAVSTTLGSEPIELTLYDGQGLKKLDEALIAGFEKQYPNVTITGTWDPDDVTTQNQPRQLASANPPDLARIISVTDAVKNGLVTNLDPYAQAYGWDQLPASQLVQFRVDDDNVAGSGSLYAKPSGFTMTGLYYNKALAQQIGMTEPPASVDELTTLLGKAKSAGLQPIMTGNQQGGAVLSYQLMLNTAMGVKPTSDWVFNVSGATIDNPDSIKAATVLDQWTKAGYLPDGVNGIDGSTASGEFAKGTGVFYPSGNWDATTLNTSMTGNVGFMAMPPMTTGGDRAAMSDAATAFGISAKSTKKDAAAAFLNYLSSDDARQAAIDAGFMPSGTAAQPIPTIPAGSVLTDVQAAFQTVSAAGGQVPFVQNATPGISNRAWTPESQLLLDGQSTPEQFVANVQKEYESELSR
jgi:multiple sugar transport system substrate-binding protein/raffinose/stachyose/melibiose transport system substrate-binding protein